MLSTLEVQSDQWIVDSGATCHMCNDKGLFDDFSDLPQAQDVTLGDGHNLKAVGRGSVTLELELSKDRVKKCKLHDVLYVPNLSFNLLSVAKASDFVSSTVFNDEGCQFLNANGEIVATGLKNHHLYYLNIKQNKHAAAAVKKIENIDLWHRRYGHLGKHNMKRLSDENMVIGFNGDMSYCSNEDVCEPCADGKQHRTKFPANDGKRSDTILGLVHSDVCGKMSTQSLGGANYFLTFIDDKSRYTWVYVLKRKDEVFEKFKEWKSFVEKSTGEKLKIFRTDNGGEYTSDVFEQYLRKDGIEHQLTTPKNPEQNGVAERMNRTIVEMARCMFSKSKLPKKFWAETVNTAVYIRNRSPTNAVKGMTPYQCLFGDKPRVDMMKVFGCLAYSHIPKDERKKFNVKTRKCIFLGYSTNVKAYRLYDCDRQKIIHSRDVIFNEFKRGVENNSESLVEMEPETELKIISQTDVDDVEVREELHEMRPVRDRRPPNLYGEWVNITSDRPAPNSASEALKSHKKKDWRSAMEDEIKSLNDNDVFDLVDLPDGKKTVGSKWVFKEKVAADGSTERLKARLVAQGYTQRYGQDYDETFSPVVRAESIRTIIAHAANNKMLLHQMDIKTAFLNGNLKEEVFMKQPEGFVVKGQEHLVCKLKKSIYGLKQSPRCWNMALHDHLCKIGFKQSASDPCIYTAERETVILAVYVDDIILATKDERKLVQVKKAIANKFTVKDMGELKYILGVNIHHSENGIWIGQRNYTENVLKKFNMDKCKSVSTPVDTTAKLTQTDGNKSVDEQIYQSAVGSLLYLSLWTRPDIAFAVSSVARFCWKPEKEHWTAGKRIMRYLNGTINLGLLYTIKSSEDSEKCVGYSDADWAGDLSDRKSTSGYVFQMSGAAITWRSKKQSCVAISTAEAEYMALACAAQEAVWLQQLISDLKNKPAEAIMTNEDNQSAIAMSKNPQFHGRAKHVDIKFHFIRELLEKEKVTLKFCPSEDMIADMLTKGLGKGKLQNFRDMIGLKEFDRC